MSWAEREQPANIVVGIPTCNSAPSVVVEAEIDAVGLKPPDRLALCRSSLTLVDERSQHIMARLYGTRVAAGILIGEAQIVSKAPRGYPQVRRVHQSLRAKRRRSSFGAITPLGTLPLFDLQTRHVPSVVDALPNVLDWHGINCRDETLCTTLVSLRSGSAGMRSPWHECSITMQPLPGQGETAVPPGENGPMLYYLARALLLRASCVSSMSPSASSSGGRYIPNRPR